MKIVLNSIRVKSKKYSDQFASQVEFSAIISKR